MFLTLSVEQSSKMSVSNDTATMKHLNTTVTKLSQYF